MGTSVLIDIAGSVIIGGILMLILFRINNNATQNTFNFSGELSLQENMVVTAQVLDYDFNKMGYWANHSFISSPIIEARDTSIAFQTDVYPFDGTLDEMKYYIGPASELTSTANKNDKILYRVINGVSKRVNLGITSFKITYYDKEGNILSTPVAVMNSINSIRIEIIAENVNQDQSKLYKKQFCYVSKVKLPEVNFLGR